MQFSTEVIPYSREQSVPFQCLKLLAHHEFVLQIILVQKAASITSMKGQKWLQMGSNCRHKYLKELQSRSTMKLSDES